MGLGTLLEAAVSSTSIRKIIETSYTTVEEVSWLTSESWMRASGFAEICPREEVLVSISKVLRKREGTGDSYVNFAIGKGIHSQLQESILPGIGIILGEWECTRCGAHYGVKQPDAKIGEYAVKRPTQCSRCEDPNGGFRFHEYHFTDLEHRIGGHPDGVLSIPGITGLGLLEAKSISPKGGWEIYHVPKLDHVIQSHIYMWLTGLGWTKILYWDKGVYGLSGIVEHTVERDEETVEVIKATLKELWDGLRHQRPPETRICASIDAPRAEKCVVAQPCFARPEF